MACEVPPIIERVDAAFEMLDCRHLGLSPGMVSEPGVQGDRSCLVAQRLGTALGQRVSPLGGYFGLLGRGRADVARRLGFPVLVRPSYVLGGRAMVIAYDEETVRRYMREVVEGKEAEKRSWRVIGLRRRYVHVG